MKSSFFVLLAFSSVTFSSAASYHPSDTYAIVLDDNTFGHRMSELKNALVMFCTPRSDEYQSAGAEYEEAAKILRMEASPIHLVKIDCITNGVGTCTEMNIEYYPTLYAFRHGQFVEEYKGPRKAHDIVEYVRSNMTVQATEEPRWAPLAPLEPMVVGYFDNVTAGVALASAFLQVEAELGDYYRFGLFFNQSHLRPENVTSPIVIHRSKLLASDYEPSDVPYEGEETVDALRTWIVSKYHGLVGIRTPDNRFQFSDPLISVYASLDYVNNTDESNKWRNVMLPVARDFKDIEFAYADVNDFEAGLKEEFNLDELPVGKPFVVGWKSDRLRYRMEEEFNEENFREWVQRFSDDKLPRVVMSQPIPKNNTGAVKVAVANNFEEVVVNNGMDTFVFFYLPWCPRCEKVQPFLEIVAEKLKSENVSLVKMNAYANDLPEEYDIVKFPALYFLPKNAKNKPVPFDGGVDVTAAQLLSHVRSVGILEEFGKRIAQAHSEEGGDDEHEHDHEHENVEEPSKKAFLEMGKGKGGEKEKGEGKKEEEVKLEPWEELDPLKVFQDDPDSELFAKKPSRVVQKEEL